MISKWLIFISIIGKRCKVSSTAAGSIGVELGRINKIDAIFFLFAADWINTVIINLFIPLLWH